MQKPLSEKPAPMRGFFASRNKCGAVAFRLVSD
jgi:hypothetical protein